MPSHIDLLESLQAVKEITEELTRWGGNGAEREKQETWDSQEGETRVLGSGNRAAVSWEVQNISVTRSGQVGTCQKLRGHEE